MLTSRDTEWMATWHASQSPKETQELIGIIKEGALNSKKVALDFETSQSGNREGGVNPLKDIMHSVSFCCNGKDAYAFQIGPNAWDAVGEETAGLFNFLLDRQDIQKFLHNIKFDAKLIYRITLRYPDVFDESWDDTMVMAYLSDENKSAGLKKVASRILYVDGSKYERRIEDLGKINQMASMDWNVVSQYNCADSWMTYNLYPQLKQMLDKDGLLKLYESMYKPFLLVLLEAELRGFLVDKPYLGGKARELNNQLTGMTDNMRRFTNPNFNPRSVPQMRTALTNMGLAEHIKDRRVKTGLSTDYESLMSLSLIDRTGFVQEVLNYRDTDKKRTFVEGLLERLDENDIIRTGFLVNGTVTGRLSSRNPNLQNLPAGPEIRSAFISRPTKKMVIADASQIELRLAAWYAQDPVMLDVFRRGGDIHSRTAIEAFKLDCTEKDVKKKYPDMRRRAKDVNFGVLYGLSSRSLAIMLKCTVEEAQVIMDRVLGVYQGVVAHRGEVIQWVIEHEYVTNAFGRKRRFPGLNGLYRQGGMRDPEVGYQTREAYNALIQGSGADICDLGITYVKKWCVREGLEVVLLAQVHDETVWEVNEHDVEKFLPILHEASENIIIDFPIPFEVIVVDNWGEKYARAV